MSDGIPIFASARDRRHAVVGTVVVVLVFVAASVLVHRAYPWITDPTAVRTWIGEFGVLAPLAFFAMQVTQVVIAPVPGHVMGVVSGYLFGAVLGTAISLSGAVVGTIIAVWVSRRFGRPFVERVVHAETLDRFDVLSGERGLLVLFVVFLLPGLPDDVICFAAGLTRLSIGRIVVVATIGRFPGFFLANLTGARIAQARYLEVGLIVGAVALATGVAYIYRRRLLRLLGVENGSRD